MQEHCDFGEQIAGADSQTRTELTVRLPEDRTVAVDVNVSTAANGWQRQRIAVSAEALQKEAIALHRRMLTFNDYYQHVGNRVKNAVDAYNRSAGSFDSRIVPQGRKFAQLTTVKGNDFRQLSSVERAVREPRYADETQPRLPENSSNGRNPRTFQV